MLLPVDTNKFTNVILQPAWENVFSKLEGWRKELDNAQSVEYKYHILNKIFQPVNKPELVDLLVNTNLIFLRFVEERLRVLLYLVDGDNERVSNIIKYRRYFRKNAKDNCCISTDKDHSLSCIYDKINSLCIGIYLGVDVEHEDIFDEFELFLIDVETIKENYYSLLDSIKGDLDRLDFSTIDTLIELERLQCKLNPYILENTPIKEAHARIRVFAFHEVILKINNYRSMFLLSRKISDEVHFRFDSLRLKWEELKDDVNTSASEVKDIIVSDYTDFVIWTLDKNKTINGDTHV